MGSSRKGESPLPGAYFRRVPCQEPQLLRRQEFPPLEGQLLRQVLLQELLQEPQQAQQGQEQHHLHDQHRRPRGRRPASASRRTSSSTCSTATPASQWRSQTCPRERRSPWW